MTTQTAPQPRTDQTFDELVESLTGFEEVAIADAFGKSFQQLAEDGDVSMFGRAMIAVHIARDAGIDYPAAYRQAMGMRLADLDHYFAEDTDIDPDDPQTESGNGDGSPATSPEPEPSGASTPDSHPPSTTS